MRLQEARDMKDLNVSRRILMGPGPVDVDPRVLSAGALPMLSHLDPEFLKIMDDVVIAMREIFQTKNEFAAPVPGTGHAGMEASLVSLLEPGDTAVVAVHGVFGERMADIVERAGASLVRVDTEWGEPVDPKAVKKALDENPDAKLFAIVHGETSTGILQPMEEITDLMRGRDTLLVVDTVSSLGGVEVQVDKWGIDVSYAGSQKCLSAPPGMAPVTMNEKAVDIVRSRKTKVQSWYLDLSMLLGYWGKERFYHHTAPINTVYSLREALRLYLEEGREANFARYAKNGEALQAGLEAMGLRLPVPKDLRMPQLNVVEIPGGIEDKELRGALVRRYGIEIGGGLGKFAGRVWRIGLMGYSGKEENIILLLTALNSLFAESGVKFNKDAGVEAALEVLKD